MQCSVKGAYPLRDDVFKQGESDARTKAFAGIIHPPTPEKWKDPVLLCPMCSRGSLCVDDRVFTFHPGRGKRFRGWNSTHPDLVWCQAPSQRRQDLLSRKRVFIFSSSCQSLSETYTDVPGLRCRGNLLIHWSAVVTILHSAMITPHWDLDWRGQLKVVSVKLTNALLCCVIFNDKLTVEWCI